MKSKEAIRIVFFWSVVAGYVVGMLKALTKCDPAIKIDVVFWDKKHINYSNYIIDEKSDQIKFHARSTLTDDGLVDLLFSKHCDIIYVSGWVDKGYLQAVSRYRIRGGKAQTVCGIDDQWKGTLRQYLGKIYFRLFYAKLFDFMWVAGKPQYHYAQRFGYGHEKIISNLLSADNEIFKKKSTFSKRFIFIGRFEPVKGLDHLIDAYQSLPETIQCQWPLILIGDGQLRYKLEKQQLNNIIIKPFMQPETLIEELMIGGVACVNSHSEPWAVVIHEMAILGYPLVLSSSCGAATEFLISGYNGFLFKHSNLASLREALLKITSLSNDELELFSQRSHNLGRRITSEQVAHSLLSVIPLSTI